MVVGNINFSTSDESADVTGGHYMFKNYKPDKLDYAAIVLFIIVIIVALYLRH